MLSLPSVIKLNLTKNSPCLLVCSGVGQLTMHIVREEGFQGLFRGLSATMARELTGCFFFFGGYESSKRLLAPAGKTKEDIGILYKRNPVWLSKELFSSGKKKTFEFQRKSSGGN